MKTIILLLAILLGLLGCETKNITEQKKESVSTESESSKPQTDKSNSSSENTKPLNKQNNESKLNRSTNGKYLSYDYVCMEGDLNVAVVFPKKKLPRNDEIVVGAIKHIISKVYSEKISSNVVPKLVPRNGVNAIMLSGKNGNYYAVLIKEDTGEVHSFTISRE
jgi:hypothetical protein